MDSIVTKSAKVNYTSKNICRIYKVFYLKVAQALNQQKNINTDPN